MSIGENIGFGCAGLSAMPFEKKALQILSTAYDQGITHFDTAPLYGRGYSEKILGKFIRGQRDKVTVATKFGLGPPNSPAIPPIIALPLNRLKKRFSEKSTPAPAFDLPAPLHYRKIDAAEIKQSFESSLANLRTDYIDFYLLHEGMPSFLTDEAILYLSGLQQGGYIKNIGIAAAYVNFAGIKEDNFPLWRILQYENSLLHNSDMLITQFPAKFHIYHSVLAPLRYKPAAGKEKQKIAGMLIAEAIKKNPSGKILFSSSKEKNISDNIQYAEAFVKYSPEELNKMIENAFR